MTTGLWAVAFATGMLAPINPCGFALLPAYLAYQPIATTGHNQGPTGRLIGGLRSGIAVTLGFAAIFTLAGLAVSAGLRPLLTAAPWLGLAVGVLLAGAGVWLFTGHTPPAIRLPRRTRPPGTKPGDGFGSLVAFGAGYAIASLSCTLAILLAIIAQALAAGNTLSLIGVFAAYTLGAATLLIVISVTATLAGAALTSRITRLLPAVPRIAAIVLTLAGLYLIIYWTPVAFTGQPATSPLTGAITAIASPMTRFVAAHQGLIAIAAAAIIITAISALFRRARQRNASPAHHNRPSSDIARPADQRLTPRSQSEGQANETST